MTSLLTHLNMLHSNRKLSEGRKGELGKLCTD